jgi:type VI secretion system secreted protein Hcp
MAVDMFLKLDGVDGESLDKTHAKEIDILNWSWGGHQTGSGHTGGGSGTGKVLVQDLSVTKYVDKSSTVLFKKMCSGDPITKGKLVIRKAGGSPLEYIKISMENVLVSSISMSGASGEDRLTEHVVLHFSKVNYEYVPQKADGSADASVLMDWHIAANAEK